MGHSSLPSGGYCWTIWWHILTSYLIWRTLTRWFLLKLSHSAASFLFWLLRCAVILFHKTVIMFLSVTHASIITQKSVNILDDHYHRPTSLNRTLCLLHRHRDRARTLRKGITKTRDGTGRDRRGISRPVPPTKIRCLGPLRRWAKR